MSSRPRSILRPTQNFYFFFFTFEPLVSCFLSGNPNPGKDQERTKIEKFIVWLHSPNFENWTVVLLIHFDSQKSERSRKQNKINIFKMFDQQWFHKRKFSSKLCKVIKKDFIFLNKERIKKKVKSLKYYPNPFKS